ncbi:hypothetical protein [Klebsiella pneumoniae IS39]|nr:hypothetical protein [Klebsiella pneumoniae IS39]
MCFSLLRTRTSGAQQKRRAEKRCPHQAIARNNPRPQR